MEVDKSLPPFPVRIRIYRLRFLLSMKKKQIIKPTANNKKKKTKWFDVFITTLAIVVIGGFFVWLVVHTYQNEKHESEMLEKYKATLPAPGVEIEHQLVCMVGNRYLATNQMPVIIQNKTYYVCGEKSERNLNSNEADRFAVDPYSNAKVDKALAFISMSSVKPGSILYFESEQNAKKYFKK